VATRQAPAEIEVEQQAPPQEENQVTRPSDLGFPQAVQTGPIPQHREIEVEAVEPPKAEIGPDNMVEIRMAETIEEFTYGNPHYVYRLEAGKRYRVPVDVARYLHSLGYIYIR
jgi:hypothetical protein